MALVQSLPERSAIILESDTSPPVEPARAERPCRLRVRDIRESTRHEGQTYPSENGLFYRRRHTGPFVRVNKR